MGFIAHNTIQHTTGGDRGTSKPLTQTSGFSKIDAVMGSETLSLLPGVTGSCLQANGLFTFMADPEVLNCLCHTVNCFSIWGGV